MNLSETSHPEAVLPLRQFAESGLYRKMRIYVLVSCNRDGGRFSWPYSRRSRLFFSLQIIVHCASAADAMISISDSSSMAESGLFVIAVRWGCTWWTSCILIQSISDTARAVKFCVFLPGFFGVRVKEPFTVRQWELSPPQTPHLSSTLVEPISLSQPTFWRQQQQQREVGLTLMQP